MAYGVVSHGRPDIFVTYTDVCRFWPAGFSYAQSWMDSTRPSRFDLTPLNLQMAPAHAPRGTFARGTTVVVHKHSTQDFDGLLTGLVYLSRNRLISAATDTYTGYLWKNVWIPAMQAVTVTVTFDCWLTPSIPPGVYHAGLILGNVDGKPRNQTTLPDDTDQILVY